MAGLLSAKDLNKLSSDAEQAKIEEERRAKKKKEQQQEEMREAFSAREIHPDVMERLNRAISAAASQGNKQLQVLTFHCSLTNDRGRRINNFDPDWPASLEGFAKKAYEFYEKELRPLGFTLRAEIISFPDGMPGDVGLFLKW